MSTATLDPTALTTPVGPMDAHRLLPASVTAWTPLLHAWVTHPRSVFWGMGAAAEDEVTAAYAAIAADPHHDAFVVLHAGRPTALVETYDPQHSSLAGHPLLEPGDVGMHLLVAPPAAGERTPGLTAALLGVAVRLAQHRPGAHAPRRVVVEPDERNTAIHALNARAGFTVLEPVPLPDKTGLLSVVTPADFAGSEIGRATLAPVPAHLTPAAMDQAQRHLCAKAIRELSHERLVAPEPGEQPGSWRLTTRHEPLTTYTWTGTVLPLEHPVVQEDSLARHVGGAPAPLDAQDLITELKEQIGLPDQLLGTYLEEIAATLAGHAWKSTHHRRTSQELLHADLATVEAAMTEGHPCFLANNGRLGFSLDDHERFAPEAGADVTLEWLAVRRSLAHLALAQDLDEDELWRSELGPRRAWFDARLAALGHRPQDYLYLPVHPWQWQHKHQITFAPDVARGDLVHLGPGDRYRAQQSIRTFLDVEHPQRRYVKTALAIQNMGFLRGLSPAYMQATPLINDWVAGEVADDAELTDRGFTVLREVATVGYTGDAYHRAAVSPAPPQQKMVAALWRQSPEGLADRARGESLRTMASLLHRDGQGEALVTAMIRASGLPPADWVSRWLDAYLRPVAHCLLAHDLAFMPHGENVILVVRDHVVARVVMKDIGEECAVLTDRPLPPGVERIRSVVPAQEAALAIFTDVYDGVLRHVAEILHVDGVLPADDLWGLVHACLDRHRRDHPQLHRRVDLFAEDFAHSCLNRLQLRNTLQMVDLADQSGSLMYAGRLTNPASDARRR
ncbi:GNAT family N-acetyltransferase [Arsenicicoccus dermatophilus]|uniref:GNAT family N-acetyltransferase n=1 Tax=Arsenicicoccus dermatophilus TaxID=1076331 RepID=UPI001F4C7CAC|nr:GNAT family N-acetyltransferase [Arsenicicoccus dermatophilus]MCH8613401.1 GNAT family N-acetyltransferase [Arsenicicoccus dermatophilus]